MKRVALAVVFVAACATTNKNGPRAGSGAETDDGVVCSEVSDTGSMFTHTECKPREQKDAETDAARRIVGGPKSSTSYPSSMTPRGGGAPTGR